LIFRSPLLFTALAIAATHLAVAQGPTMSLPKTVEAGKAFSVQSTGSGNATLYIVGPGQVLKRDVQLGKATYFPAGSLYNAGHYLAVLAGESSTQNESFDLLPATKPVSISFFAKPSRLPIGLHDGITGAVYIFDTYHNLIPTQTPVSFELSTPSGAVQRRIVVTHEGAAWTAMDSTAQQGVDKFVARIGDVSSTRIVGQVPGDPCGLKMSARLSGQKVQLVTDPVRDCSGNAIPDGTIVTFTETYNGTQSTIDEPLKHGIAEATLQIHTGARLSVASGVVVGNQIGWSE
jgi:hypothetical protein